MGWPEGYTTAHRDPVAVPIVCRALKRVTQNAPVRLRQKTLPEPQDNLDLAFKGAQSWRKSWNWSLHASKWENWQALWMQFMIPQGWLLVLMKGGAHVKGWEGQLTDSFISRMIKDHKLAQAIRDSKTG